MRVLIDILRPAHVHFLRLLRSRLIDHGHAVLVTARDEDVAVELLDELAIAEKIDVADWMIEFSESRSAETT